ncbi:putative inorganic carbon transporter subunit DabA [Methylicorpusculum sp.]|uniref:putative inorganic carbon transporter subunit DabA n=1 Tax=Methylicorpusculum sp. TaxID=2713644 RepID=UPI002737711A|nr:putative inorganic carbon transporter subunit DabA [Methylicorpusculum sp.]
MYPSASCQEHYEQQAGKATDAQIDAACEKACLAIAPAWPLDRAIAVNPHWGRINRPLRQVAARMALLGNIQVFPTREYLREAWAKGRMTQQDLFYALATLQHGEDN